MISGRERLGFRVLGVKIGLLEEDLAVNGYKGGFCCGIFDSVEGRVNSGERVGKGLGEWELEVFWWDMVWIVNGE